MLHHKWTNVPLIVQENRFFAIVTAVAFMEMSARSQVFNKCGHFDRNVAKGEMTVSTFASCPVGQTC